jgi:hypothetical protein
VSFMAFYERGFGVPPHQFLHSLLRYYGLELHHVTPSGVLHIAAFVTLCEAYLRIIPDFDLWKYFFRVRRPQDPEVELTISGGIVIHVKSGHGVDPYLEIPMPRSMKGWQKKWFYMQNNDSALVPSFTGGRPIPLTSWGEGVVGKDLSRIQPLREYLKQLRQEVLTGIHLLRTFFSHRIQPLWRRKIKMWMYPGSSCPDCLSTKELSEGEVEARIHKVLDSAVIPSLCVGPDPLQRWIASVRVSTLGPVSIAFVILSFHCAHDLAQGLKDGCDESRDVDPSVDAPGLESRHASNGATRTREERERDRHAASRATRKWGMEVPTRSVSSGDGEMERGVTRPPPSSPRTVDSP